MPEIQEQFAKVYRFAFSLSRQRELAEDIAQECMLKAIENKVHELPSQNHVPWLMKVARNLWLDRAKSSDFKCKLDSSKLDVEIELPAIGSDAEEQEEIKIALAAMDRLPDRQRQVLYLRSVEELSINEIAETLQMSKANVKTSLSLARKKMREMCKPFVNSNGES